MNERILLIRPNHTQDRKDDYVTFPLGLGYIAAVLIKRGYKVCVIDLTLEDVNYDDLENRIKKFDPNIIGISALSYEYLQVKELSAYLKRAVPSKIILGGLLATYNYDLVLNKTDVEICVIGEGELTIIDLLENLSSLAEVKGIAYEENGNITLNPPRELISDLDTLPFPAYDLFDIDEYSEFLMTNIYVSHKYLPKKKIHRIITLESGRGCPFACQFCSKVFTTIRRKSVDKIIEEMKYLQEHYSVDIFGFQDELFFFDKNYIYEFCQKIKPLGVSWYGNARVNTIDRETLELIVNSNCLTVAFGVESGSEKILKNMNKKTTPSQIEETLKNALEVGLPTSMGLILGYPGEDKQSVQDTLDLLKRVGHPGIRFRYITPYPGSALYDYCLENGVIENEEEYMESLGDGTGPYRFRVNLSDFTDEELTDLLPETIKKAVRNYLVYLLKHPIYLFKYLTNKDVMNPIYYYYSRWSRPTNYDRAAKKRN